MYVFHKQGRISRTAAWYLAMNPHRAEQICRFDVISINPQEKDQGINWIKSAFYSTQGYEYAKYLQAVRQGYSESIKLS